MDGVNGFETGNENNSNKDVNGLFGVAHTQNQASDLAKALIQGIISLQKLQSQEEKNVVIKLFNKKNIQLIKNQKLFYYGMLDEL